MSVAERALGKPRTRAERVRARRAREIRQREPLANLGRAPRRRRPRKRYDLAIPAELGAEVRLPAVPVIHPGTRLLSLGLLVLVIWALNSAYKSTEFRIGEAEVEGTELLSPNQIRSIAGVDRMTIFGVDPAAVEERLMGHPELAEVRVRVSWPNQVQIAVVERVPMIEWDDGGRTWWLSADGVAFLRRSGPEAMVRVRAESAVLDIQEDPLHQVVDPEVLLAASVLSAQVPEVGELLYDPVHGLGFVDSRGWRAVFGVRGDMVMKVRLYDRIASGLLERGVTATVVSVENPAAPYYLGEG